MSICEETVSPGEAKVKFQSIADSEFAEQLQQEEFCSLKGDNVSSSQTRHQTVSVGSRVANKVALQEEALYKIIGVLLLLLLLLLLFFVVVYLFLVTYCCLLVRDGETEAGGDGPDPGGEAAGPGEGRGRGGADLAIERTNRIQSH